jgi:hypothetical protein
MRLLAAIACTVLLAGCNIEADFSDNLKTETLSAEEYQQEIAAIDRLVFTETPLGDDGVTALETRLNDLASRITVGKPDSKFLKLESLELKRLALAAKRIRSTSNGAALKNEWMRIRNNLFDDRAWFARSAADLEYAATAVPPPAPAPTPAPPPVERPVPPQFSPAEARTVLNGSWRVVSVTANGTLRDDPELRDAIWTFDPPRLVVQSAEGGGKTFQVTADGQYLAVSDPEGPSGWMKYEIDAEGLRVAFFDGLKGKPSSFDPPPEKDPLLVVVRMTPVR